MKFIYARHTNECCMISRQDDLREAFPNTWVSSNDNVFEIYFYLQSIAELF